MIPVFGNSRDITLALWNREYLFLQRSESRDRERRVSILEIRLERVLSLSSRFSSK